MNISNQTQIIPYLGSKFSYLSWLLPLLKQTHSFVDVFGGSGAVVINKKPSKIDTYNDLNKRVVNFMRVLRDHPDELIRSLYLTPHSRLEYEEAWDEEKDNDIERARKFYVRLRQSFFATGAQNEVKGWCAATKISRCRISEATSKYLNGVDGLSSIVERLRRIQIECRSYEWILTSYDTPNTMFYVDPPYDQEKRSSTSDYEHDFTHEQHVDLRNKLAEVKGYFAVSGYNTAFMKDLYKDFIFTQGPQRKSVLSGKVDVKECLWTNYDPYHCNKTMTLFQSHDTHKP